MDISVFGLGYFGSVTGACLANNGHFVIGIDIKREKVDTINAGKSPVFEKGLDKLINEVVANGKLKATLSVSEAIEGSEISLICVGTPSNLDGSINLEHIKRVCSDMGRALKVKNKFHVVVIRSTILPGTTESILIPILEKESGKKAFEDLGIEIEIDTTDLYPNTQNYSKAYFVKGTIKYPEGETGTLFYIKTTMTGTEPGELLAFYG